jgi:hypothetical protein
MKLIGRKTVKGGTAPKVKTASNGKAAVAVSLSADPTHEEISARAYELYLARGSLDGYSEEDWLLAEAELRRK